MRDWEPPVGAEGAGRRAHLPTPGRPRDVQHRGTQRISRKQNSRREEKRVGIQSRTVEAIFSSVNKDERNTLPPKRHFFLYKTVKFKTLMYTSCLFCMSYGSKTNIRRQKNNEYSLNFTFPFLVVSQTLLSKATHMGATAGTAPGTLRSSVSCHLNLWRTVLADWESPQNCFEMNCQKCNVHHSYAVTS